MKKRFFKKAEFFFVLISACAIFSSCTDIFGRDTVEKSIEEVTVTFTLYAGDESVEDAEWAFDNAKVREVKGIKGLPVADTVDIPVRPGYRFLGWEPPMPDKFPQEDASFTATWIYDVASVTLRTRRLGLEAGQTERLEAVLIPECSVELAWSSSDSQIVTVDQEGNVRVVEGAKVGGAAVITVKTPDGESTDGTVTKGKCAKCQVIVAENFGDLGAYKAESSKITFGVFPQSALAQDVGIYGEIESDEFEAEVKSETGKEQHFYAKKNWAGQTYYLGTDGAWYAKAKANTFVASHFESGGQIEFDREYYFKVEPIEWEEKEIDSEASQAKKILLAKKGLAASVPFYGSAQRTLGEKTIYGNNYKYSNIRAYLNGTKNQLVVDGGAAGGSDADWSGRGFIDVAFTKEQSEKIAKGNVNNARGEAYASGSVSERDKEKPDYSCEDTSDKIFLLSRHEESALFSANGSEQKSATDYAKANYAYSGSSGCVWALRSPKPTDALNSLSAGERADDRTYVKYMCVVPAIFLPLN